MSDSDPAASAITNLRGPRCNGCGVAIDQALSCSRCGTSAGSAPQKPGSPQLVRGFSAPFRGFGYLMSHKRLWAWVFIPLLLNTALFAVALNWTVDNLADLLPNFDETWPAWIDWARVAVGWLLEVLVWMAAALAAALATLLLAGVINSPFYDVLSEKVESVHFGRDDPGRPWSQLPMDLLRSVRAALSLALRQALVLLVLFFLSFTAVGAPLFAVAGMYYAGLAQLDVTLARKLYAGSRRARWARRHWGLVLGTGLPLSMLPLLAPFGIVGTTLAFLEEPDKA